MRRVLLSPTEEDQPASASAEAAALVVRSTLASLSSGGRIGVAIQPDDRRRGPAPAPQTATEKQHDDRGASEERSAAERAHLSFFAEVGLEVGVDGREAAPFYGPALSAGLGIDRWLVGAGGGYATERNLEDSLTRLRLSRYSGGLRVGRVITGEGRLVLAAVLEAGVVVYDRRTDALDEAVTATPDQLTAGPSFSLESTAAYVVSSLFPLRLFATLGADVVPRAPILRYSQAGETIERGRFWPVQPRLMLGLAVWEGS